MSNFYEKTEPVSFHADRTINIYGQTVSYRLTAEDTFVKAEDGTEAFDFFCYAYTRTDVAEEKKAARPVVFAFNGGPTSSSTWMHLGFWGPRIAAMGRDGLPVKEPLGQLRDNPDCMLDLVDIVMIDPVNCGFSRLQNPAYAAQCYGDHEDADSVARFILAWLEKYGRMNSPVYISGESYGSTRASLLSWYLKDRVKLMGLIHIGPGYSNAEATLRTYKDFMPAAAISWYYTEEKSASLEEWIAEAREFMVREYVPAYHQGSMISHAEKQRAAERLAYFTGLPADYYMTHDLKVDRGDFRKMRLADRGLKLGNYDARFTLPLEQEGEAFTEAFDPAMTAGMENLLAENGIRLERKYRSGSYEDDPEWDWNYNASPDMIGFMAYKMPMDRAVSEAMKQLSDMRLFFATGYYDTVATVENTRYSVTHTDVPIERVTMKEYESGHAVYADDASRHKLALDVRAFVTAE